MNTSRLLALGMVLIFVGFIVVAAGALTSGGGSSSTGGFILIGPIPIVFGNGPNSSMLATVGLVITVVMVAFYLLSFFFWRSGRRREMDAGDVQALSGIPAELTSNFWADESAEAAGIKVEGENKWLTLIQNASIRAK